MGLWIQAKNDEENFCKISYSTWHIVATLLNDKSDLTKKLMKKVNDVCCEINDKHSKKIAEALFILNENNCKDTLHGLGLHKIETTDKQLLCPYCGMFELLDEDDVCSKCGGSRETIHVWADGEDYNMQMHFDFQTIYEIARLFNESEGVELC